VQAQSQFRTQLCQGIINLDVFVSNRSDRGMTNSVQPYSQTYIAHV